MFVELLFDKHTTADQTFRTVDAVSLVIYVHLRKWSFVHVLSFWGTLLLVQNFNVEVYTFK